MKKGFTRTSVEANNLRDLQDIKATKDGLGLYYGLLAVLADAADTAAGGGDCYCTFGITRDKGSLLLTVNVNGGKLYASGGTLDAVATAALELLD